MSGEATGNVWKTSPYTGVKLVLHLAVADVVNDMHSYEFWLSPTKLADKARCSREAASRWLWSAVEDGVLVLVEKSSRRDGASRFRYVFGESRVTTDHATEDISRDDRSRENGSRVTTDHASRDDRSRVYVSERKKETVTSASTSESTSSGALFDLGDDDYRKIKTAYGGPPLVGHRPALKAKRMIAEAVAAGFPVAAIVEAAERSVKERRGWSKDFQRTKVKRFDNWLADKPWVVDETAAAWEHPRYRRDPSGVEVWVFADRGDECWTRDPDDPARWTSDETGEERRMG